MDLHLYYMNADKIKTVAVALEGNIVIVTPVTDKVSKDFQLSADSLAFSYTGVRNLKLATFLEKYVYIEKLSEEEMYRVFFKEVLVNGYKRPHTTHREAVDKEQIGVLKMLSYLVEN